jgi:AcrR family transcriptional regulator
MSAPRRGRPRSQDVDSAIHRATLQSLVEFGYAGTSIDGIAAGAGVGRPTVYRRYGSKAELLTAAVAAAFHESNPSVPDSGDSREDVRILLTNTIRMLRSTPIGEVVRAIVPELARHDELRRLARRLLNDRRELLRAAIHRGIERGDIDGATDVEITIDGLLGAIYLRLLFTGQPIPNRLAGELVGEFLRPG